jgi:hypothetical protein
MNQDVPTIALRMGGFITAEMGATYLWETREM